MLVFRNTHSNFYMEKIEFCPRIDIEHLGGMLIWFYSCMALYLEHYFYRFLVVWTDNAGDIFCTEVANFHFISVE